MAQIGMIKLQTAGGTIKVPVYELSDFGSDVHDIIRVQTSNGVGAIPLVNPSDASHNYLRIQTQNHGVLAAHDKASLFQGNTIFEANFEQSTSDSTGTTSVVSSSNVSYSTNEQEGSYSLACNDTLVKYNGSPYSRIPEDKSWSIFFYFYLTDSGSAQYLIMKGDSNDYDNLEIKLEVNSSLDHISYDDFNTTLESGSLSLNTWYHCCVRTKGEGSVIELLIDGEVVASTSSWSGTLRNVDGDLWIGRDDASHPTTGNLDKVIIVDSYVPDSQLGNYM